MASPQPDKETSLEEGESKERLLSLFVHFVQDIIFVNDVFNYRNHNNYCSLLLFSTYMIIHFKLQKYIVINMLCVNETNIKLTTIINQKKISSHSVYSRERQPIKTPSLKTNGYS